MIRFNKVSHSYKSGQKEVKTLDDLTFFIDKPQFVCVLGPNGSGKSTLLKLIKGLLVPDKGDIFIDEYKSGTPEFYDFVLKRVGYITENPQMQIFSSKVIDDLVFGLENLQFSEEQARKNIENTGEKLQISHLIESSVETLSSGELQKVALAGVLVVDPLIILSDESTAWLDPENANEVIKIFLEQVKEGKTVIHVTHNPHEAIHADRIIVLKDHRILIDGDPESVFFRARNLFSMGINVPLASLISEMMVEKQIPCRHPAKVPEELFTDD